MSHGQLPDEVVAFARYLRELTGRLDRAAGWYGVFAQRDPEGMRACLRGQEVPPWDVVQALLQDLSVRSGPDAARQAGTRAADLYRASILAHDARPGGSAALRRRLDLMLREQEYATQRERDLEGALRTAGDPATRDRLDAELAWARDDRQRAMARCEELTARLTALTARQTPRPAASPAPGPRPTHARPGPGVPAVGLSGPGDPAPAHPAPVDPAPGRPEPAHPAPGRLEPDLAVAGLPGEAAGAVPAAGASGGPAARVARPRPRGARFAGIEVEEVEEVVEVEEPALALRPEAGSGPAADPMRAVIGTVTETGTEAVTEAGTASPPAPAPTPAPTAAPRGARFAGAYGDATGVRRRRRGKGTATAAGIAPDTAAEAERLAGERLATARQTAAGAVAELARLRALGRGGEAHALLCETAGWPADWLPLLATELERAGLDADVPTLLWEVACLPSEALAAAAAALAEAGRTGDCARLLRQSVARPAAEVGDAALALRGTGHGTEASFLLTALVRARTPEEAAGAATDAPAELVPLLLDAAQDVSTGRRLDLAHALRLAGLPGVPGLS